jgi:hypothetical protein
MWSCEQCATINAATHDRCLACDDPRRASESAPPIPVAEGAVAVVGRSRRSPKRILIPVVLVVVVAIVGGMLLRGSEEDRGDPALRIVYSNGAIEALGAPPDGDIVDGQPIVAADAAPNGVGYWTVSADGHVRPHGDVSVFAGRPPQAAPIVGIASTPSGRGYWLASADGGVFTFGDASFYGASTGLGLQAPIVDIETARDGQGYWLVAEDCGVFAFGSARFHGPTTHLLTGAPITAMSAADDDSGYWLLAADGGVFAFGDVGFHGSSTASSTSAAVDIASTADGRGYLVLFADGQIAGHGVVPDVELERAAVEAAFAVGLVFERTPVVGSASSDH